MGIKRITWLDVAKGIGIITVILGHMGIPEILRKFIFSFHMPLFFFLSGYLHRNNNERIGTYLRKKTKSLVLPYIYFSLIIVGIWAVIYGNTDFLKNGLIDTLNGNGGGIALWFLLCLFFVEAVFSLVTNFVKKTHIQVLLIVLLALLGYVFSINQIQLFWKFDVVLVALSFYAIGFWFKMRNYNKFNNNKIIIKILCYFSLSLVFCFLNPTGLKGHIDMNHSYYGNFLLFYLSAIFGLLTVQLISIYLKESKVLIYLGQNSLILLALHKQVPDLFRVCIEFFKVPVNLAVDIGYRLLSIVILLVIIKIINKYLPFLLGKNYQQKLFQIQFNGERRNPEVI